MLDRLRISFLPVEDRLELVLVTKAPASVHRLHLTRRVTRHWLEQLARMIELSAEAPAELQPATRQTIAALNHESLAARAKVGASSADPTLLALAQSAVPVLVTGIECGRHTSSARWVLRFAFVSGESVSLNLTSETLHGAIDLLARQLQATDWGLSERLVPSAQASLSSAALH